MNNKASIFAIAWLALPALTHAQTNDISSIIRQAQSRSSLVQAAVSIVEARKATSNGSRLSPLPVLELSPGIGYTNGNSILSQDLDVFGRRRATSRLAFENLKLAEIGVAKARSQVTLELLNSVAQLLAASEEVESAKSSLESAKALQATVAKRQGIGEAPAIHVARAELEVLRASQQVLSAEGRFKAAQASVKSLTGQDLARQGLAWPTLEGHTTLAAQSFDLLEALQGVALAQAQREVDRSGFAPSLAAGLASDLWSLDRDPFRSENLGFQVSLRMPLFRGGQKRSAMASAEAEIKGAEARVAEARRLAELALARAQASLSPAQAIVSSYDGDVLPKGEAMLTAMRDGYASGLLTLVEVLEAQQTLSKLRQERIQAFLALRLAEVELWRAQLTLPGTEVPR